MIETFSKPGQLMMYEGSYTDKKGKRHGVLVQADGSATKEYYAAQLVSGSCLTRFRFWSLDSSMDGVATLYVEELKATMRGRYAWLGAPWFC
jgi:hypothetical protein